MILLYPLLLVLAGAVAWRRRGTGRAPAGRRWFGAWFASGLLLGLSFLSALSIGLFILPFAAALLLWTAGKAPDPRAAIGFVAGLGVMLGVLSPFVGTVVTAVSLVTYWTLRQREQDVTPTP